MNYKNYLKEQLLSEIRLQPRDFDPNLLSPKMKLKMGSRKGPDGNIIGLKNHKFQPSKENSMIEIKKTLEQEMRDTTPGSLLPKRNKREMIDRMNRGEFNQSDLGAQPLKLYKKKFNFLSDYIKKYPDNKIY